jgi:hypothetical protein
MLFVRDDTFRLVSWTYCLCYRSCILFQLLFWIFATEPIETITHHRMGRGATEPIETITHYRMGRETLTLTYEWIFLAHLLIELIYNWMDFRTEKLLWYNLNFDSDFWEKMSKISWKAPRLKCDFRKISTQRKFPVNLFQCYKIELYMRKCSLLIIITLKHNLCYKGFM